MGTRNLVGPDIKIEPAPKWILRTGQVDYLKTNKLNNHEIIGLNWLTETKTKTIGHMVQITLALCDHCRNSMKSSCGIWHWV